MTWEYIEDPKIFPNIKLIIQFTLILITWFNINHSMDK